MGNSLAVSAIGLQSAGAVTSTIGSYFGTKGQQTALNGQADVAEINARLADEGAATALQAGQREEQRIDINTSNLKGTERADFGANGIDISGGGSPIRVLNSTETLGQIDANTAHLNAIRTAFGYKTQATNYTNQARTLRTSSKTISPLMAAGSTLLEGASSVAKSYYTLNKNGAFSSAEG